jgi:hypothetical protein
VVADQLYRGVHVVRGQDRVAANAAFRAAFAHAVRGDGHRGAKRGAWVGQGLSNLADPGAEGCHGLLAALLVGGHAATVVGNKERWHNGSPSPK